MQNRVKKGWNKFRAKRVKLPDGTSYDSTAEYNFQVQILMPLRAAGKIKGWQRQNRVDFPCGISWKIDYRVFIDEDTSYYVEVKGGGPAGMREYKLKIKCFLYHYDDPIYVVTYARKRWKVIAEYRTKGIDGPLS